MTCFHVSFPHQRDSSTGAKYSLFSILDLFSMSIRRADTKSKGIWRNMLSVSESSFMGASIYNLSPKFVFSVLVIQRFSERAGA